MDDLADMTESLGNFSNSVPETPISRGARKTQKMKDNQRVAMVGAAGIEPATPTMSTRSGREPIGIFRYLRAAEATNAR
ncbi:hypothetical protein [Algihabitans sp.]|uniref:hypothetical protein n=1 Tax=Algihabitans sp. TaxID=2821514 RepID=UPI003BAAD5B9